MKKNRKLRDGENAFTWLLLSFSLAVLIMACCISGFASISSPGMFPMAAAAVMVISTVILLIGNRKAEKPVAKDLKEELRRAAKEVFSSVFLIYTAIVIGYMIIIQPLHFLPSSFGFLLVSMIYLKGSTAVKSLIISIATLGGIYFVFHYLFRVVLP